MALPVYYIVKEKIKEKIVSKKLAPATRLPTLDEIGAEYGISRATAFKVMEELGREGFVSKKHGVGIFVSDSAGRGSVQKDVVFMAFTDMAEEWFSQMILKGVKDVLLKSGYRLIYRAERPVGRDTVKDRRLLARLKAEISGMMKNSRVAGMVLVGPSIEFVELLKGLGVPFVVAGDILGSEPPADTDVVAVDTFKGTYEAVRYLAGLKHRRIGLICASGRELLWVKEMVGGYRKALEDSGIPVNTEFIVWEEGSGKNKNFAAGYGGFKKLAAIQPKVTAIICELPWIAAGALKAAAENGVKIPGDMSVIVRGEIIFDELLPVELTQLKPYPAKLGKTAAEILLGRIAGTSKNFTGKPRRIVLDTKLVVRGSCRAL